MEVGLCIGLVHWGSVIVLHSACRTRPRLHKLPPPSHHSSQKSPWPPTHTSFASFDLTPVLSCLLIPHTSAPPTHHGNYRAAWYSLTCRAVIFTIVLLERRAFTPATTADVHSYCLSAVVARWVLTSELLQAVSVPTHGPCMRNWQIKSAMACKQTCSAVRSNRRFLGNYFAAGLHLPGGQMSTPHGPP